MEESKEQQSLHRFLQFAIYLALLIDVLMFVYAPKLLIEAGAQKVGLSRFLIRMSRIVIYEHPLYSRFFSLILISLVSIGTLSKKEKDLDAKKAIIYPLSFGLVFMAASIFFFAGSGEQVFYLTNWPDVGYMGFLLVGTILVHVAMDNVSKIISSSLGKDKWNTEEESFMQARRPVNGPFAVNIPSLFYYRKKVHAGFICVENIFRGTLLIGTPGSGKSFGVVMPFIRQLIYKQFCICCYDFKFPDLGQIAYYHYLLGKKAGRLEGFDFHVINLTQVERSRRINVLRPDYILTLADAGETAEALVEALKKGDKSGGSDQFFTQSAVNFLSSCIYFFSQYEGGKYSTFPHVLSFLNCSYEQIFSVLFTNPELKSLLSPFATAWQAKAFNQLEGQIGTLKVFISRLATKETFWVFSGDDFNLKISSLNEPSMLVLANDPNTQNINSACYSVVLNRLTRLINSKGNRPSALIIDELPTLFVHRIENLIATARSNKVAVLMGLQELPQFQQQYGKDTATTITSVVGNVLSGSVRNKETLEWLERLFGKVKQQSESLSIDRTKTSLSLSEKLESLIPAGKIASLKAGELVGMLAADAVEEYTGKYETSAINCRVNLDMDAIAMEEKAYPDMPVYYDFAGKKEETLRKNFLRINEEIQALVLKFRSDSASAKKEEFPKASMAGGMKR
ncbi:type IV secretion system DNA-binding domain-containing protein [Pedobacter petrophilus]|uniref:Type IV secretion system DNA-binding domain-containing protein n=1 Tax=Pedobacter petrophilus TaxID=1908241 RepID=A0A7K0FVG2_9SPHI|nr:type IV secretory system conjugative DNA transfer family protein [Pedobacter petrophilus]MRX74736.1 type IV secretion system DNA-binding domain-containing protein [Pedobacter petrophilus]